MPNVKTNYTVVAVNLNPSMLRKIDYLAAIEDSNRCAVVRRLIVDSYNAQNLPIYGEQKDGK